MNGDISPIRDGIRDAAILHSRIQVDFSITQSIYKIISKNENTTKGRILENSYNYIKMH